ncbi:Hpt domain-containing protein [Luteimonas sp. A534]
MTDISERGRYSVDVEDAATRRAVTLDPGAEPANPLPFDVEALCAIVGDEPAVLLEIVACFDTVATGMRAELLRAAADADAAAAAMLAHRLKSSSRSVGALPLGALCETLDEHGEAGRSDMVAPLVAEVVDAMDAALAAMRCWRGAQTPAAVQMTRYAL